MVDGTEVGGDLIGDAGTTNAEQSGTISLNGYCTNGASDLVIEIYTQTWAQDETVTFSNITVECWDATPVAEATPNPICEGDDLQLDETSGDFGSWDWTGPNGFSSTMQNPVINNISPGDAGTYEVEVQDPNACNITDAVDVTVNMAPSFNTLALNDICSDEANPFDLTVYEDSINMQSGVSITFYDGEPGNGGSPIGNPSAVDLTSIGTLWAQVDDGNCTAKFMIPVSITPAPMLDPVNDVTACTSYTLPNISGSNLGGATTAYYTQANGQGMEFQPGDMVTSTWDPLYIYAANGNCTDQTSFVVTIDNPPMLDPISDTTTCTSFTLPTITGSNLYGNEVYYTGPNQTGTMYNEGATISSTTTLYATSGDPSGSCYDEVQFQVTILQQPDIDPINDVTRCAYYVLPAITGTDLTGNEAYFDQSNGNGNTWQVGDTIFSSTTLYAFDDNGSCSDEESFQVTIDPAPELDPIMDITACESYTLPSISGMNLAGNEAYYTGSDQSGTMYNEGATISSSTTLYATSGDPSGNCYDELQFQVTILQQPDINPIDDVTRCTFYVLPAITGTDLTGNEAYYDQMNGNGNSWQAGDTIFSSITLFAFDGSANCTDEESFSITINPAPDIDPILDDTACTSYTLPSITGINLAGNEAYYTGPGQTGTMYNEGATISTTTTLYATSGDPTGNCYDEEEFQVTIVDQPDIDPFDNVMTCNFFVLPPIAGNNLTGNQAYYDQMGGNGTQHNPGDTIFNNVITLYAYDSNGFCFDEESIQITINEGPDVDPVMDITTCTSYTLPDIDGTNLSGNEAFYTGPGQSGTMYNEGATISTTTTLYATSGDPTGNCYDEEEFQVTIVDQPDIDPIDDVTVCGSYTLPPITGTNLNDPSYFTGPNGSGTEFMEDEIITSSGTLYAYDATADCSEEESFQITIQTQEDASFSFEDFCIDETGEPEDITTPGGTFSFNPPPGDGAAIDPNTGEIINPSPNTYSVQYITSGNCPDTAVQTVTVNALPEFINVNAICDPNSNNYIIEVDSDGDQLSATDGTVMNQGGGDFTVTDIPEGTTVTLTLTDLNTGCDATFSPTPPDCDCPQIDPIDDTSGCDYFILPPITGNNIPSNTTYYNAPNGGGTSYEEGDTIFTTTTLYAYYDNGNCSDEEPFDLTISSEPQLDSVEDVTACRLYELPPISGSGVDSTNSAYYTQSGGSGTQYLPGDTIAMSLDTLYIYAGMPGCEDELHFSITILPKEDPAFNFDDFCVGEDNEPYSIATPGGTFVFFPEPGDGATIDSTSGIISNESPNTYNVRYMTPGTCPDTASILVDVHPLPELEFLRTECLDTVPFYTVLLSVDTSEINLSTNVGNLSYVGEDSVSITMIPNGSQATISLTNSFGCEDTYMTQEPNCDCPQISPIADTGVCDVFVLPPISGTGLPSDIAYYTGANGSGTRYEAGDTIDFTSTLYAYYQQDSCEDEEVFDLTVSPSVTIDMPDTITGCDRFILPAIDRTPSMVDAAYYTQPGGNGIRYEAGDTLLSETTLYLYAGIAACNAQDSVFLSYSGMPELEQPADIFSCDFFVLPAITADPAAGNEAYYTGSMGSGTMFEAGDTIHSSGTFYIYSGYPGCSDEVSFDINIIPQTDIEDPGDLAGCDSVVLPPINGTNLAGNEAYYTGSGGTGTMYNAGDVITSSTTLYIFGGNQDCPDQEMIEINISGPPDITAPFSYESCNFFVLQQISGNPLFGNEAYYTEPGGNGVQYNPGDTLFSTDTLYIYGGTSGCSDEEDVFIYIYPAPRLAEVEDTSLCGPFVLPGIAGMNLSGNEAYYTDTLGSGDMYLPGDTIDQSLTLYIYDDFSGCRDEVQFALTVFDQPVSSPMSTGPYCAGDSILLSSDTSDPGLDYSWGGPNGFSGTGEEVLVTPSASPADEGTYWLILDNGQCNSDTGYIDIEVREQFPHDLGDTTLCDVSGTIDLDALFGLPDTLGNWSGANVTNGMLVPGALPTVDSAQYSALGFCNADFTIQLRLNSQEARTDRISEDLCIGDSIIIDGTVLDADNPSDTMYFPGASVFGCDSISIVDINILPTDTLLLDNTLCTGASMTVNGTVYDTSNPTGTEILQGQAANGCDSVVILDLEFIDVVTESLSQSICPGDTIHVAGVPYHETNLTGQEIIPGGSQSGCDSIINVDLSLYPTDTTSIAETLCPGQSININGTIYDASNPSGLEILEGQTIHGCDSFVRVDLDFNALNLHFDTEGPNCTRPDSGQLILDSVSAPDFELQIDGVDTLFNQNAPLTVQGLMPGNYEAAIIYSNGQCRESFSFDIPSYTAPDISLGPDIEVQDGETVILEAAVNFDPIQVSWSPDDLTNCDTCTRITISPTETMTVTVTAWAGNAPACIVSDSMVIRVVSSNKVYIPNAFSPNNDGINDFFSVYSGGSIQQISSIRIFNRWGDLVYEDRDASPLPEEHGWNGRFRGQRLNPGVFVYAIEVEFLDGTTRFYKGEVTLIR